MKASLSDTQGWLLAAVSVSLLSSEPNSRAQSATRGFFDETGAAPERPVDEPPAYNILRYEEDYCYLRDLAKRTDYLGADVENGL